MRRKLLAAALAVGVMGAFSAEAAIILPPGHTWNYTTTQPGATWTTDLIPSGAGWTTGAAPFGSHPLSHSSDPNHYFNAVTPWNPNTNLWVHTTFDAVPGWDLSTFQWNLGVDNGFTLFVNGHVLGFGDAEGYTSRWEYNGDFVNDLNQNVLIQGVNVIAVALTDRGGYSAFDMQVQGDYTAPTPNASAVVPIPAAAPLGLLGMGLIGLISRRRNKSA